jgi:hypothetical protein
MRFLVFLFSILLSEKAFAQFAEGELRIICSEPMHCDEDTQLDGVRVTTAEYKKAVSLGMIVKREKIKRNKDLPTGIQFTDEYGQVCNDNVRYVRTNSWWMVNGMLAKSKFKKSDFSQMLRRMRPIDIRVLDTTIKGKPRKVFVFFPAPREYQATLMLVVKTHESGGWGVP